MADLSVIGYVFSWVILIVLCRKPLYLLLMFTFGVYFVCLSYNLTDNNYATVSADWSLFSYVKRGSLVVGYLGYIYVYNANSKASRIILQWIVTINVFEAGVFSLEYLEIIPGILLICVSPFSPQIFVNKDKTLFGKSGNILQIEKFNYLSVKWYFRCHLIILFAWYIGSVYFNETKMGFFAVLTVFLPFILNEYYFDNFMNHFSIRAFALIIGTVIDSSFDLQWFNKQPTTIIPPNVNIILRNVIQFCIMLFLFGLTLLNDKFRENKKEAKKHENTMGAITDGRTVDENTQKKGEIIINTT